MGHIIQWTLCQHCKKPFQAKLYLLKGGRGGKYCDTTCYHAAVSAERLARPQGVDLTGQKFGRWTVLGYHGKADNKSHVILWACRCECGKEAIVSAGNLKSGKSKSCGCLKNEMTTARNMCRSTDGRPTHGMSGTRLHRVWLGMKARCQIKSSSGFYKYGARGIKVCDEWQEFEPFKNWALANGYSDDLEIDRIDNDGSYEPGNCRFVTKKQNALNKRTSRFLTINGEAKTVVEWADEAGVIERTIRSRLARGWKEKDVLAPTRNGGTYSVTISRDGGIVVSPDGYGE